MAQEGGFYISTFQYSGLLDILVLLPYTLKAFGRTVPDVGSVPLEAWGMGLCAQW